MFKLNLTALSMLFFSFLFFSFGVLLKRGTVLTRVTAEDCSIKSLIFCSFVWFMCSQSGSVFLFCVLCLYKNWFKINALMAAHCCTMATLDPIAVAMAIWKRLMAVGLTTSSASDHLHMRVVQWNCFLQEFPMWKLYSFIMNNQSKKFQTYIWKVYYEINERVNLFPTWVRTVHVDKLGPSVVVNHSHQSVLELRPQLDDKLIGRLDGEGRGDEADMQRSAERHEHVDRLPVIQTNDGIHTLGELGANYKGEKRKEKRERGHKKMSLWTN